MPVETYMLQKRKKRNLQQMQETHLKSDKSSGNGAVDEAADHFEVVEA